MNINVLELTLEEAQAILSDEKLILASREEVEQGQTAIARADKAEADKAALEAHVERLRGALVRLRNEVGGLACAEIEIRQAVGNTNWNCLELRVNEAHAVLDETPAQSMAACKAEVLLEAAKECQEVTDSIVWGEEELQGRQSIICRLLEMAERLQVEAANG